MIKDIQYKIAIQSQLRDEDVEQRELGLRNFLVVPLCESQPLVKLW